MALNIGLVFCQFTFCCKNLLFSATVFGPIEENYGKQGVQGGDRNKLGYHRGNKIVVLW